MDFDKFLLMKRTVTPLYRISLSTLSLSDGLFTLLERNLNNYFLLILINIDLASINKFENSCLHDKSPINRINYLS
jgi:hypothetical protein